MSRILFRRGIKADLPALTVGEPGFSTDTKELFVGSASGNEKMWGASTNPATLAVNGYQKLASGLILQWGTKSMTGGTSTGVVLPIAFPAACIGVWAQAETSDTTLNPQTGSYTSSQFNIWLNGTGAQNVHWFAIGW